MRLYLPFSTVHAQSLAEHVDDVDEATFDVEDIHLGTTPSRALSLPDVVFDVAYQPRAGSVIQVFEVSDQQVFTGVVPAEFDIETSTVRISLVNALRFVKLVGFIDEFGEEQATSWLFGGRYGA